MSADVIQTLTQILDGYPDNTSRLITPQNVRQASLGAFGAIMATDPTPQDDSFNTAGNGYFDSASRWLNTTTPSIWECVDGAHNAASWVQVYPPPSPGPSVVVVGTAPIDVVESPTGTFTVSLLTPLAASDVDSGYPFSSLSGSASSAQVPDLDTIAGYSGPLSASNLSSGYPFSDLTGSASSAQVPDLDTIAGYSGPLSASNLGSGYPYSDLSGAPSIPTTAGNSIAFNTAAAFTTILHLTAPNGLIGSMRLIGQNIGLNSYDWKITVTDTRQGAQTYTGNGVNANLNTIGFIYNFDTSAAGFNGNAFSNNTAPVTDILVEVRYTSGWTPAPLLLDYVSIAL